MMDERERALLHVINDALERCAKIAEAEKVGTVDQADEAYNRACDHIAAAIREQKLK